MRIGWCYLRCRISVTCGTTGHPHHLRRNQAWESFWKITQSTTIRSAASAVSAWKIATNTNSLMAIMMTIWMAAAAVAAPKMLREPIVLGRRQKAHVVGAMFEPSWPTIIRCEKLRGTVHFIISSLIVIYLSQVYATLIVIWWNSVCWSCFVYFVGISISHSDYVLESFYVCCCSYEHRIDHFLDPNRSVGNHISFSRLERWFFCSFWYFSLPVLFVSGDGESKPSQKTERSRRLFRAEQIYHFHVWPILLANQ